MRAVPNGSEMRSDTFEHCESSSTRALFEELYTERDEVSITRVDRRGKRTNLLNDSISDII